MDHSGCAEEKQCALDGTEFDMINAAIDDCILASVNAYAMAQSALRERFIVTIAPLKYSPPDTIIRIGIDCTHERMLLAVHNEGDSIPQHELESIFQVFRRATAAKESA